MFFFIIWCFAYCVFQITASSSVLYQEDGRLALSDSLSAEGMVYYQQGEYQKALQMCEEALRIQEETVGKKHPKYVVSLSNLALYHSSLGNYGEAIRLTLDVLAIQTEIVGTKHPEYAVSLGNLAQYYYNAGHYPEAIQFCTEALCIKEKTLGKQHPDYAMSLGNLALYQFQLGDYEEAIRMGTDALRIIEESYGKETPVYANYLTNLAHCYFPLGNYSEAVRLGTEALLIKERTLGKEHPDYAVSLHNLAQYNYQLGNYTESVRLITTALGIIEKRIGKESPYYVTCLSDLALYYYALGDCVEAIRLGEEALSVKGRILGTAHYEYAMSLEQLAQFNFQLGNYAEAVRLSTDGLHVLEKLFDRKHLAYVTCLGNLAAYYSALGNYFESARITAEVVRLKGEILSEDNSEYAMSLGNLAYCNYYLGNYAEAVRLGTEALHIIEKVLGKEHPNYAMYLDYLARYYASLGNYKEAVRLDREALNLKEKSFGKEHFEYALSLGNLAHYYFQMRNYVEAIQLGLDALHILEKIQGKESPNYATQLSNLALYNALLGNYAESVQLSESVLNITVKAVGKEHSNYAQSLGNLALYHYHLKNYAKAIQFGIESVQIKERIVGKEHPDNLMLLNNLANYYADSDHIKEAVDIYKELTSLYSELILSTFTDLTSSEQSLFWNKYYYYFNNELPQRAYSFANDSLYADVYNGILLSKGLLLNAEIEMNKLLQENGDTAIVKLYENVRINRSILNKSLESPVNERFLDTDSLRKLIRYQEQQLVKQSKTYGDYTRNLSIGWQEVQKMLEKSDIALEFLTFPTGKDSIMYAVMALKQDMKVPEMIPLFEEKELKQIVSNNVYSTTELYRLVWEPLEEKLDGVNTIYFAPSGELYNLAIETLPDTDSTWVSDRFNFYRLSSTRQLALVREDYNTNGVRIYGGLKYDTDISQLVVDNQKYHIYKEESTRSFEDDHIADSLQLRSGAQDLPATKIEAENIKHSLDCANVENELYSGVIGTEASFKAMSGKKLRALHIATHGFYWTEKQAGQMKQLDFLVLNVNNQSNYVEDKALTRSGLLMSGANNALMGIEIPEGIDNGVLTAKEIAELDLRGMDMVVLSACQTGLGEITGEGVFGLQRGFKKAGAKSLLMSLWKVDDNATQMLMTQFYVNLIAGMNKYEALREAQRYVREYEIEVKESLTPSQKRKEEKAGRIAEASQRFRKICPYKHPKDWAAFILLDGID